MIVAHAFEPPSSHIAFMDRDRMDPGHWIESRPQPTNRCNLFVITKDCFLELFCNGILKHKGPLDCGTIILSRPDQEVVLSGMASVRFLQIRFTVELAGWEIANTVLQSLHCNELHIQSFPMDVGLGILAKTHESACDHGISEESPYFSALREAMLNRIMVLWSCNVMVRKDRSEMLVQAKARRVIEYIEINLGESLTLAHLSAVAGASRAHFARAFRNSIGMSPHQFVRHRRLAKALHLIRSRELTLSQISHSCGFSDQAHLTRTFKILYGDIPTSFGKRPI